MKKGLDGMDFQKIMVAYDVSERSKKALRWAIKLAKALSGSVVIVTVVKPPEFSSDADEVDSFCDEGRKYYQPFLDEACKYAESRGVLKVSSETLYGHKAESIVRYASDNDVDLIVMGTRGMGGFANLVVGSVAQKVMEYANVPVTVIK